MSDAAARLMNQVLASMLDRNRATIDEIALLQACGLTPVWIVRDDGIVEIVDKHIISTVPSGHFQETPEIKPSAP